MTPSELLTLIQGDVTALAMANAGNDSGCAARCTEIASQIVSPTPVRLGQVGIIQVFANAGQPTGGDAFLTALETLAASNNPFAGTIKRLLASVYPPSGDLSEGGLDFTNPTIVATLSSFVPDVLSQAQVDVIIAATKIQQVITADQVSTAMVGQRKLGN